jgi:hypothetical protein
MTQPDFDIQPASLFSVSEPLIGDDGAPVTDPARRAAYAAQIGLGFAWEARAHGALLWIGGFSWREDLQAAECWFVAAPGIRKHLRWALDAAAAVARIAHDRFGAAFARVGAGSARLVKLAGFAPCGGVEDGCDLYVFRPEAV